MAGIYVHIPYCKQACSYCNFHFSTSLGSMPAMVDAIIRQIETDDFISKAEKISTVYFGGGTPSLLTKDDLARIFKSLNDHFTILEHPEITLEANPDDINNSIIDSWVDLGINRLSLGVQSFVEEDLRFMNRAHDAKQSHKAIEVIKHSKIDNFSVDLIYGTPTMSDYQWDQNIDALLQYEVPHISSYCLTVEEKTALHKLVKEGKTFLDEEIAMTQYEHLINRLTHQRYQHYEISSFAKDGCYSRHNRSYWSNQSYLGIGPGAHSYNGVDRRWNIAHNPKYIQAINQGQDYATVEKLSQNDRYNEYVMTRLRTMWGVDRNILSEFGDEYSLHFSNMLSTIDPSYYIDDGNKIVLTNAGKKMADGIASALFRLGDG